MNVEVLTKAVELMIKRAAESSDSNDALKFSHAACNAANAMNALYMASFYEEGDSDA